jgi:two-component sensor histidine kinase
LPERFADRVPPLLVEIAIGVAMPVVMTLARMGLAPWTADRAPYAFVFVAAVGATLLAGLRSGILAIVIGQLLAWLLIVDPAGDAAMRAQLIGGLSIATFAQLIAVTIIWLYQQEVGRAWLRREEQLDLVHQALAEIDHRTTNNYQTVLALVLAQAKRADAPVKQALMQVADRIEAIAMASKQLALGSDSLGEVRLAQHLGDLCRQIIRGLARPDVNLECHFDDLSVDAEQAVAISIIINELVTNALKHAFPDDRRGTITVSLRKSADRLQLEVADDGIGMTQTARTRRRGVGSRLIDTFVKQLGADHQLLSDEAGTRHLIDIPANG